MFLSLLAEAKSSQQVRVLVSQQRVVPSTTEPARLSSRLRNLGAVNDVALTAHARKDR